MLNKQQEKAYKKLSISLGKAIDNWIDENADSDEWADIDTWHGENEIKLMTQAAISVMKNSTDSQNFMKKEGIGRGL